MRKIFHILLFTLLGGTAIAFAPVLSSTAHAADTPTILVPAAQGPTVKERLMSRAQSSWPWYITRASGIVAAISLVILLLSGVGFITGRSFVFLEPLTAWATHRATGIVFAVSIFIHGIALLFDNYVPFTITELLFPFVSHYHTATLYGIQVGSLYVALGIIAMYLVAAMVLSTYLWIDKKPRLWKTLHFLSYLIMLFVFVHALYLGTDLTSGPLRITWIVLGIIVGLAFVVRLSRRARAKS